MLHEGGSDQKTHKNLLNLNPEILSVRDGSAFPLVCINEHETQTEIITWSRDPAWDIYYFML